MTIQHLVISGGGPIMIQILGALEYLDENNFLNMEDIKTIYGTSSGAMLGVLISLKFDWETINDYIIKRPWEDVFPIKIQNILDAYSKKGIFDIKTIEKCFKPLFDAKDIDININLDDFYKLTNIELHLFTFEINEYKVQDISYLTHPTLSLMNALLMTCALPLLVTPACLDNKCFIDGGMSCNYPLKYCIESHKNHDEILGFKNKYKEEQKTNITSESTLIDFLLSFLYKAVFSVNTDNIQPLIKNEVICDTSCMSVDFLQQSITSIEIRKELFKSGKEAAELFLQQLNNSVQELS
jgi:predicted acylesterase/phospholipase RssA